MKVQWFEAGVTYIELIIVMLNCVVLYCVIAGSSEAAKRKRKMTRCAEGSCKLHLTPALDTNEHNGQVETVASTSLRNQTLSPGAVLLNP